jgi:hypothetical protein
MAVRTPERRDNGTPDGPDGVDQLMLADAARPLQQSTAENDLGSPRPQRPLVEFDVLGRYRDTTSHDDAVATEYRSRIATPSC